MAHDSLWKVLNRTHRVLLRTPFAGRFWRRGGMPVLELTTTGRRSHAPHSVMLTAPVQEGDAFVVVASRGGDPQHPAWYLNLRDDPQVQVRTREGIRRMVARTATVEERSDLWPRVTSAYPDYEAYQQKSPREIPLVLLAPS